MPSHVLYQVPYAAWPVRVIMIVVSLIFVLGIFGWWLPRSIGYLRDLKASASQTMVSVTICVIPVIIGFGPLAVLIALISNPQSYVTDTGVIKEGVFHGSAVRLAWGDISRVQCWSGKNGAVSMITLIANDGRRIDLGNTGDVDFASMLELFQNQLGPVVVRPCVRGMHH